MAMMCDGVVANITSLYLGVILLMKLFGLVTGKSFSGWVVIAVSSFIVGFIFVAALTWDVSRKASYMNAAPYSDQFYHAGGGGGENGRKERCRGGICWHGVSVQSSVSQIRFQLPQHPLSTHPPL